MEKVYSLNSLRRLFDFPDEDMHSIAKDEKRISMSLMGDKGMEVPTYITVTKTNKMKKRQTRKMMFDWAKAVWKVLDPKGKVGDLW